MFKFFSKSFDFILLVAIVFSMLFVFIDFKLTLALVASLTLILIVKKSIVFLSIRSQKKV